MSFSHHRRHSMDPVDPTAMPSCSHWPIPQRLFGAHNGWITLPCWKCVLSQPGTCADSETVKNPQSLSLHWVTQRAEAAPRKYRWGEPNKDASCPSDTVCTQQSPVRPGVLSLALQYPADLLLHTVQVEVGKCHVTSLWDFLQWLCLHTARSLISFPGCDLLWLIPRSSS